MENLGAAGDEMEKRAEDEKDDAVQDIKDAADIKVCGAGLFTDATKGMEEDSFEKITTIGQRCGET